MYAEIPPSRHKPTRRSLPRGGDDPQNPRRLGRGVAPAVRRTAVERRGVAGQQMVAYAAQMEVEYAVQHEHALLVAGVGVEAVAAALPRLDQRLEDLQPGGPARGHLG